jgi:hypothetical protein
MNETAMEQDFLEASSALSPLFILICCYQVTVTVCASHLTEH